MVRGERGRERERERGGNVGYVMLVYFLASHHEEFDFVNKVGLRSVALFFTNYNPIKEVSGMR